jgi:hypothetical protein
VILRDLADAYNAKCLAEMYIHVHTCANKTRRMLSESIYCKIL